VNVFVESLLRPGLRIMQAVRLPVKFGIVCAALLVPLCVAIYGVLSYARSNIEFARDESLGVAYVVPLNELLQQVMTPGATGAPHALDALEQLTASQGDALDVAATIKALAAGADVAQTLALFTRVSDNSKLTLDPDLDSYYAMAIVMDYAPKLAAAAAQGDAARTSMLHESVATAVERAIAANPALAKKERSPAMVAAAMSPRNFLLKSFVTSGSFTRLGGPYPPTRGRFCDIVARHTGEVELLRR